MGGNITQQSLIDGFRDAVDKCKLRDLHVEGYRFTWSNNREGGENIQEHLDHALVFDLWFEKFPCSKVEHLSRRKSNHAPINITIQKQLRVNNRNKQRKRGFRFEKKWLRDDECGNIVAISLSLGVDYDVLRKIKTCANNLNSWSKSRSYDFSEEITYRRDQMKTLIDAPPTAENIGVMRKIDHEIDELELREEEYWA
ncbi:uncharacterized protein LOC110711916 [Chenopodium quinoa]|uniref:uncharacterized protein LOC110711916 n=1 Tax=Chenopodium quinoa TaxID=63459 RepID=UPI000B785089|nr:uncharacterized protein LOC110711916 [Chenopodium quinoa]